MDEKRLEDEGHLRVPCSIYAFLITCENTRLNDGEIRIEACALPGETWDIPLSKNIPFGTLVPFGSIPSVWMQLLIADFAKSPPDALGVRNKNNS